MRMQARVHRLKLRHPHLNQNLMQQHLMLMQPHPTLMLIYPHLVLTQQHLALMGQVGLSLPPPRPPGYPQTPRPAT